MQCNQNKLKQSTDRKIHKSCYDVREKKERQVDQKRSILIVKCVCLRKSRAKGIEGEKILLSGVAIEEVVAST